MTAQEVAQQELLDYMAERRCRPVESPKSSIVSFSRLAELSVIAALLVGGLLAIICLFDGSGHRESKPDPTDNSAPITYAQGFVKDFLKSPATASFPWDFREYIVTNLGGGLWRVAGYVDSQNGFGATVRTRWTVEMQDAGSTWKLADARIN